jgi:hypothetical protein
MLSAIGWASDGGEGVPGLASPRSRTGSRMMARFEEPARRAIFVHKSRGGLVVDAQEMSMVRMPHDVDKEQSGMLRVSPGSDMEGV